MRNLTLIVIAVVFGIAAAAWSLMSGGGGQPDVQTVVVASADIKAGLPITASQLRTTSWPAKSMPAGIFLKPDLVVGRVARQTIMANEPVLEGHLAPRQAKGGLSSLIASDKRAISVRVDEVIGVAGFALPGAFVDVMVSARDANGAPFSKIVLSRVKVVAAEQDTSGDPTQPKVVRAVTLELGPDDAERLDLARNIGSLSLVLRNEVDSRATYSRGARLNDIMPGAGNAAPAANPAQASMPPAPAPVAGRAGSPVAVPQPIVPPRPQRARNAYGAEEIRGASPASGGEQ